MALNSEIGYQRENEMMLQSTTTKTGGKLENYKDEKEKKIITNKGIPSTYMSQKPTATHINLCV